MNDSSIPVKSSYAMRLRLVVEMKKTSMTCLAVIVMAVVGLVAITPLAPAQSVSGSFNPQTQFPAGAGLKTTSIYAVATAPLAIQNATSIPTQGNHTFWHYNQTQGQRPSNGNHRNWNKAAGQLQPRQTAPNYPGRGMGFGGSFIFGAISAVSILLITVGVFYVLIKLGSLLDGLKKKTEAASTKK